MQLTIIFILHYVAVFLNILFIIIVLRKIVKHHHHSFLKLKSRPSNGLFTQPRVQNLNIHLQRSKNTQARV